MQVDVCLNSTWAVLVRVFSAFAASWTALEAHPTLIRAHICVPREPHPTLAACLAF